MQMTLADKAVENMILLVLYLHILKVSSLRLEDFFPFGSENGDITIIDKEKGILLTTHPTDDNYFITTPHIPFFDRQNNNIAQLSIKGYIAFGAIRYFSFFSRPFPVRIQSGGQPYQPPIIAAFWNDLSFQYNGSVFSYQIHKSGQVIAKAKEIIKSELHIDFAPNFVLVVTWFNSNIFRSREKSITFQVALACDLTTTYLFQHYNESRGIDSLSTIGWQTSSSHFHHPYNRDTSKMKLLETDTNVNTPGRWMYDVGQPAGNFPRMSRLPQVSVSTGNKQLLFQCSIYARDRENATIFEVLWMDEAMSVLKEETLSSGRNVSYFSNDNSTQSNQKQFCLGGEIYCKVRAWFESNTSRRSPYLESNRFLAGFEINPKTIHLKEDATSATINVQSTVPFVCADNSRSCSIELKFASSSEDVMLSTCGVSFGTAFNTMQSIFIISREDFVDDGNKTVQITPIVENVNNMIDWSCSRVGSINVISQNVPSGYCSVTGDPYVTTLDGLWYAFFNVGDFILVDSPRNNLKIHIRTFECSPGVTCVCGVAAQETAVIQDRSNKDIYCALKICGRRSPRMSLNSQLCGIKAHSSTSYQLALPSGVIISFDVQRRGNRPSFANVYVTIPSRFYQRTSGLCGTFDGNKINDLTSRSGSTSSSSTVWPADRVFINSWKIRNANESLLTRFATLKTIRPACDAIQRDEEFCVCQSRGGIIRADCSLHRVGFTDRSAGRNIITSNLQDCASARKRRATTNDIIIQIEDDDEGDVFQSSDIEFAPPTWPTLSGKTRTATEILCVGAILNSTVGNSCSTTLGDEFDLASFKEECISDVLISDSYDYVTSIVNSMTSSCEEKVLRGVEKYWKPDVNGNLAPPVEVGNKICPNDCLGNGICVNRSCVCRDDFVGGDCSAVRGQIPVLVVQYQLCNIRYGDCLTAGIEGDEYIDSSNLTCKMIRINAQLTKTPSNTETFPASFTNGNLLGFAEVICDVPVSPVIIEGNPSSSFGNPIGAYKVSISNDGKHYSVNNTVFLVYDAKCVNCNATNGLCFIKNNTCLISGYCFEVGEMNPIDPFQHCDPLKSNSSFVTKPGKIANSTQISSLLSSSIYRSLHKSSKTTRLVKDKIASSVSVNTQTSIEVVATKPINVTSHFITTQLTRIVAVTGTPTTFLPTTRSVRNSMKTYLLKPDKSFVIASSHITISSSSIIGISKDDTTSVYISNSKTAQAKLESSQALLSRFIVRTSSNIVMQSISSRDTKATRTFPSSVRSLHFSTTKLKVLPKITQSSEVKLTKLVKSSIHSSVRKIALTVTVSTGKIASLTSKNLSISSHISTNDTTSIYVPTAQPKLTSSKVSLSRFSLRSSSNFVTKSISSNNSTTTTTETPSIRPIYFNTTVLPTRIQLSKLTKLINPSFHSKVTSTFAESTSGVRTFTLNKSVTLSPTTINPTRSKSRITSTTIQVIPCPNSLCKMKPNGNYKYEYNPHYILQCVHGKSYCTSCWPKSLFFVPQCNQCMHSSSNTCKFSTTTATTTKQKETLSMTATTEELTSSTTTPSTTNGITTTTTTKFKCPDQCRLRDSFIGNIAHPTNQNYFISCWYGRTIACIRCPASLIFNERINLCDYPLNV